MITKLITIGIVFMLIFGMILIVVNFAIDWSDEQ